MNNHPKQFGCCWLATRPAYTADTLNNGLEPIAAADRPREWSFFVVQALARVSRQQSLTLEARRERWREKSLSMDTATNLRLASRRKRLSSNTSKAAFSRRKAGVTATAKRNRLMWSFLARDGKAYGHFEIDDAVAPNAADREAYPPVKKVYLVRKSVRYANAVARRRWGSPITASAATLTRPSSHSFRRWLAIPKTSTAGHKSL